MRVSSVATLRHTDAEGQAHGSSAPQLADAIDPRGESTLGAGSTAGSAKLALQSLTHGASQSKATLLGELER
jgi:hypothetical protein